MPNGVLESGVQHCVHYWELNSDNFGRCKLCGEERQFLVIPWYLEGERELAAYQVRAVVEDLIKQQQLEYR